MLRFCFYFIIFVKGFVLLLSIILSKTVQFPIFFLCWYCFSSKHILQCNAIPLSAI